MKWRWRKSLAGEGQVLSDAIRISLVDDAGATQGAAALAALGLVQVAPASMGEQHLAASGELESLGHGFLRFDAFGTAHNIRKVLIKKSANYMDGAGVKQEVFWLFCFPEGRLQ